MREALIEKYFCEQVATAGGLQRKFTSPGMRNVPDRIAAFDEGRIALAEIKRPGEDATPAQHREHQRWRSLGVRVYVLNSFDAVDAFIRDMTK